MDLDVPDLFTDEPVLAVTSADTAAFDERAQALLEQLTGRPGAQFREFQLEAIRALALERRRVLLVQRTGWGKTAVYFIATRLLREQGAGPTLLLSPLIALMRNQIDAAERMGLRAESINSTNRDEWDAIKAAIDANEVDLLLVSAPRLANREFQQDVLPVVGRRSGALVIDEAHCISDWGHAFVPDYRRVRHVLDQLPASVPVLGCTATANDRVVADVERQFGTDLVTIRGPLGRDGLALSVVPLPEQAERLAWLASELPKLPGSGIVYCLTVRDAERVSAWLRDRGIDAPAYHGTAPDAERQRIEQALLANEVKAVVATAALGMGFDKPDLAFVVHFQSPGSPIAYYQQVGRAGRALDRSVGVLLKGREDEDIQDWFIATEFPPRDQAVAVVELLEDAGEPLSMFAIESAVNVRHSRLESMLKILEVEGAVEKQGTGYRRTARPWVYDTERIEGITAARRVEQAGMREYVTMTGCRMALLRRMLDDPAGAPCGICDNCRVAAGDPPPPVVLDPQVIGEARAHLRRDHPVIEPRKQWPSGLDEPRGRIPESERVSPGRLLCAWGDGGWGSLVAHDRTVATPPRYRPELVDALADLVKQWWPAPAPRVVTWVPSLTEPGLVAELAHGLAERIGLPARELVVADRPHEPQAAMENSAMQVRNLWGAFRVVDRGATGPVLLVDDLVDSGWTLTVVGTLLRASGIPAVHPVALAAGSGR